MIGIEDASYTYEYSGYYKILPLFMSGVLILKGLRMGRRLIQISNIALMNPEWMDIKTLEIGSKKIKARLEKFNLKITLLLFVARLILEIDFLNLMYLHNNSLGSNNWALTLTDQALKFTYC